MLDTLECVPARLFRAGLGVLLRIRCAGLADNDSAFLAGLTDSDVVLCAGLADTEPDFVELEATEPDLCIGLADADVGADVGADADTDADADAVLIDEEYCELVVELTLPVLNEGRDRSISPFPHSTFDSPRLRRGSNSPISKVTYSSP